MRHSKSILSVIAVAGTVFSVGASSAADLPARTYTKAPMMVDPGYNWSGFYIGVNVGGDWRRDSWVESIDPGTHLGDPANLAAVSAAGTGNTNGQGRFIGGGQVGYNWQGAGSPWVVGVEADISGIGSRSMSTTAFLPANVPATFTISESNNSNWLATFRGRVGYAFNRSLVYVTGGLAVADIRQSSTYSDTIVGAPVPPTTGGRDGVRAGYAIGAGWEQAFADNWSVKFEYLYTSFDRVGFNYVITSTTGGTNLIHVSDRMNDNIVRVGLNYRFGGPVVAKY
jgi:outer membrane immunogenic protein